MKRVKKLLTTISILVVSGNVLLNSYAPIYATENEGTENIETSEVIESTEVIDSATTESNEVVEPDTALPTEDFLIELVPNNTDPIGPAAEDPEIAVEDEIIVQTDEVPNLDIYSREETHRLAIEMMEQDLAEKGVEPTSTSVKVAPFSIRNISSGIDYVDKFISSIAPHAIEDSVTSGVLPSITIAQGALESAWGRSGLTTEANNLFGIKASSDWTGGVYNVITSEYSAPVYDKTGKLVQQEYWYKVVAPFRKYGSWLESIRDHGSFFTGTEWRRNNYRNVVGEKDYRKAAQALQDAGYATDPSYASLLIRIIENYGLAKFDQVPVLKADFHVQRKGWLSSTGTHLMLGTTGERLQLEDLNLSLPSNENVGIQFSSYIQGQGWTGWIPEGLSAGNTGKALQMEAVKMNLTGVNSKDFDILYRVHSASFGWSGWTKNGLPAGLEGYGKRIEAIEVKITWANEVTITDQANSFRWYTTPKVFYSAHVQNYGWMASVRDGALSGTTGESKRMEALWLSLRDTPFSGGINYQAHVQSYGWMPTVSDQTISGTTGQRKRIEAIKLNLYGEMSNQFDVYYRTHIQSYGWTGWAKNGSPSGSEGLAKRMESFQVVLVKKGESAPGTTSNTFYK